MTMRCFLFALATTFFLPLALLASVENDVRTRTAFKTFSMSEVGNGKILDNRAAFGGLPEVQAVQTCFIIKAPVSRVASLLATWNPAGKQGLDVSFHQELSGAEASSFHGPLEKFMKSSGGSWILAQSKKATEPSCELLLTAGEKNKLATAPENGIVSTWASILAARFAEFHNPGASNFTSLVASVGKAASLNVPPPASSHYYWELSDVSHRGSISEGVTWQDTNEGSARIFDGEFFVTSEYAASFSSSTLWPVMEDGKEATLVWRIDSAFSRQFSDLHGAERLASTGLILSSVKKTIQAFRQASEK